MWEHLTKEMQKKKCLKDRSQPRLCFCFHTEQNGLKRKNYLKSLDSHAKVVDSLVGENLGKLATSNPLTPRLCFL